MMESAFTLLLLVLLMLLVVCRMLSRGPAIAFGHWNKGCWQGNMSNVELLDSKIQWPYKLHL